MVLGETIMGQDTFWLWLEWVVWMCVVVLCALGALVFSCWTTQIGARLLRRLLDGPGREPAREENSESRE